MSIPLDNFGTVVGENPDCLLLSGTVVGENPDHVCWDLFLWYDGCGEGILIILSTFFARVFVMELSSRSNPRMWLADGDSLMCYIVIMPCRGRLFNHFLYGELDLFQSCHVRMSFTDPKTQITSVNLSDTSILAGILCNPDAKRLYDDLLRKSGYNKLIRPVGNNTDKLTVKLGLRLSQLIDVVSTLINRPLPEGGFYVCTCSSSSRLY